jgi:hypothetical protein
MRYTYFDFSIHIRFQLPIRPHSRTFLSRICAFAISGHAFLSGLSTTATTSHLLPHRQAASPRMVPRERSRTCQWRPRRRQCAAPRRLLARSLLRGGWAACWSGADGGPPCCSSRWRTWRRCSCSPWASARGLDPAAWWRVRWGGARNRRPPGPCTAATSCSNGSSRKCAPSPRGRTR